MREEAMVELAFTMKLADADRKLLESISTKLDRVLAGQTAAQLLESKIMATLDDVLSGVNDESTVDDSIIALLGNIKTQLDNVLAGGLPPDQQAKVDQIFATVSANKSKVADAVTANTPSAPAGSTARRV
jgi:hypothetical protein